MTEVQPPQLYAIDDIEPLLKHRLEPRDIKVKEVKGVCRREVRCIGLVGSSACIRAEPYDEPAARTKNSANLRQRAVERQAVIERGRRNDGRKRCIIPRQIFLNALHELKVGRLERRQRIEPREQLGGI